MIKTKARACTGKVAHPTRKAALGHLWSLVRGGASAKVLVAYRCKSNPSHYHVGHKTPRKS